MKLQQREAIHQLREGGQSYASIAEFLGISVNTIKSYCRRNDLGGIALSTAESMNETFCGNAVHRLSKYPEKSKSNIARIGAGWPGGMRIPRQ